MDLASLPGPLGFLNGPGFRFMVVAFLVLMLLPGLVVLVSCASLNPSLGPCIGLLALMILVILEFFLGEELLFLFEQWAGPLVAQ